MCQINIVGHVPFPVGNYTNIDQSAIKNQSLSKLSFIANAILNRKYYCGKNQFNTVFNTVSKAQSLYLKQRLENAVQKKITDFFNS